MENSRYKFRAWDKNNEVMIYSEDNQHDDFTFIAERGGLHFYYIDSNDRCLMDTYSILMQYTGLKDKNGTEIYEGDIIKSKHKQVGKVYWSEEKSTYLIYWFEEEYNTFLQVAKDGEVIGNIYEHPHLLGD